MTPWSDPGHGPAQVRDVAAGLAAEGWGVDADLTVRIGETDADVDRALGEAAQAGQGIVGTID